MTTGDAVTDTPAEVLAAGGVVLRGDDDPRLLVVHRPSYDDWSLPKGKLDPGETWQEAAVREIHEETGVTAGLGIELSPTRYTDRHGRAKLVRWWRMHPVEAEDREPDAEVDAVRWLTPDEAHARLSYDSDRDLVTEALDRRHHRTVLVVRHAHAGDRDAWDGDDGHRPLSPTGMGQTAELVRLLAPYHVTRVASSPLVRCVQTVEPLARERGLEVVAEDRLAEGADPEATWGLVTAVDTGTVLSSHGDVIGALVQRLRDLGLADGGARWPKASTWVVDVDDTGRPGATDHLPAPG